MNIGVLTSSRADYGIYRPLLIEMSKDKNIKLSIFVFGTHLSKFYGETKNEILKDGFEISYEIDTIIDDDSPEAIDKSISKTISNFANLWAKSENTIDLLFCLGDRYEMFAAVVSTIPFGLRIAHIHGGEVTEGAIDNKFRNSMSIFSNLHFTSTEDHAKKVIEITGQKHNVFNVGALGLDNIAKIELLTKEEFYSKFNILLDNPILVTIHPETINYEKNVKNVNELLEALNEISDQVIVTLPNADTFGLKLREILINNFTGKSNVFLVESFGTIGYLSCIAQCAFLLGNSSSGIIEAASFGKYVCNLGDRQKGRTRSLNVLDCPFEKNEILKTILLIRKLGNFVGENLYGDGNSANKILTILKNYNYEKI